MDYSLIPECCYSTLWCSYSLSVRRGSQRDKDGMQKNDKMKEAEMRRASMAEMVRILVFLTCHPSAVTIWPPSQEDDSQPALQDLRDSVQIDEVNGSAALSDIRLDDTIDETKEDENTADDKVEQTTDDKVEEDKAQKLDKNEEKDPEIQWDSQGDNTIKSRDRPKSVLKNKTPTPVITTSTTPNANITNPHRDRECCNIS